MTIGTDPGHVLRIGGRAAWRPIAGAGGLACLFATVVAVTLAHLDHAVSTADVAASPDAVRDGRLWLLLTSGLLVQRPIALSLLSFLALGCVTMLVCGARTVWTAAALGHVLSTVAVYAGLSVLWLGEPEIARTVQNSPDYGVSAIAAAWVGVLAQVAWKRHGASLRGKALVVLGCVGVAVFSWWIKGHLNVLDSEHVVAFAIGVLAAGSRWRAPSSRSKASRVPGATAS